MLVVQLGNSYAVAQATLLLQRFGAQVYQFAGQKIDEPETSSLLREALNFGKYPVGTPVDSLSGDVVQQILDKVDVVVDDHSLAYWLDRGLNLKRLYETNRPKAQWCAITPYGLV